MKVRQLRTGKDLKIGNALTFMANERVASEDAVAGDIIGIHNHGQLQIGDSLTEINVTSPTCFREIADQTGFDVAALFLESLEREAVRIV